MWTVADMTQSTCAADDCELAAAQAGYCWKHYARLSRHGSLNLVTAFACADCGLAVPRRGARGPIPKRCGKCQRRRRAEAQNPDATRRLAGNTRCIVCDGEAPLGTRYCSANCRTNRSGPDRPRERSCGRCGEVFSLTERGDDGRLPPLYTLLCRLCRRAPKYYELTAAELAERDGTTCALCGTVVDFAFTCPHDMSPSVDHIVPWARGGSNDAGNLQLAHRICNVRKGVRMEKLR